MRDMFNRKEINNKVRDYLIMKKPQLGKFYILPKILKRTSNVPRRPVISNNGTATENISAFLDFHLKNIVSTILHILEDIRDFLQRLNQIGDIPGNALLVSFDVVGLYSHIYLTKKVSKLYGVSFIDVKTNWCHQKVFVN